MAKEKKASFVSKWFAAILSLASMQAEAYFIQVVYLQLPEYFVSEARQTIRP